MWVRCGRVTTFPKTITFAVTPAHIEAAIPRHSGDCPVEIALRDVIEGHVAFVERNRTLLVISTEQKAFQKAAMSGQPITRLVQATYANDEGLRELVRRWDNDDSVQPGTFTITREGRIE